MQCGFVKLDENSVGDHNSCTLCKYLENLKQSNPSDDMILGMYEPHKQVHILSRKVIRAVNRGDRANIDSYLKELDDATAELITALKNTKI